MSNLDKDINLKNLIQNGDIEIKVKLNDLKTVVDYAISESRKQMEETILSEKTETYPSVKTVCEILDVDPSTLWRWSKKNYLVPIEVGGKRRYRMSDIKKILDGGKKALQN